MFYKFSTMLRRCMLLITAIYVLPSVGSSSVVVESPFGKIKGTTKTVNSTGQTFLSFKGIPYAVPPLGDLRFAKPLPHPKLDGVLDASQEIKISCPHPDTMRANLDNFFEDCLILNIQTKAIHPSNDLKKVIVFIHGGSYLAGSSSSYESGMLVTAQDVIVVTVNYRLGVLGFLSTENEASPGNFGLWDQVLAIKWVKNNIRAFGGDPDDLTVAGESAGAGSLGFQIISPHTKGLFTKAYPHSGTATSVFARAINPQSHALAVAKIAGCWDKDVENKINPEESKNVIDCLRKAPLSNLTKYSDFKVSKPQFVPTVDGDFMPDIPSKLLKDENYLKAVGFYDRSYLIVFNNNEEGIMDDYLEMSKLGVSSNTNMSKEDKQAAYETIVNDTKNFYIMSRLGEKAASDENIVSKVEDFYERRYLGDKVLINLVTDLDFLIPTIDTLSAASKQKYCNAYFLYFDYFPRFMKGKFRGSLHAVDLLYWFDGTVEELEMFMSAGMDGEFDKEDYELKRMFSSIVGDFMKTGNPGKSLTNVLASQWPKYDVKNSQYLIFNTKPHVGTFLGKDKQDFWFDTIPTMMETSSHCPR